MHYKTILKVGNEPQTYARIDDDGKCRLTCSEHDEAYLKWVAEGNTPLPADEPTA